MFFVYAIKQVGWIASLSLLSINQPYFSALTRRLSGPVFQFWHPKDVPKKLHESRKSISLLLCVFPCI